MKLIENLGSIKVGENPKNKSTYGIYECPICKKHFITRNADVKNGSSTKCKSCSMKKAKTKHGYAFSRLYTIWCGIKDRCNNKNSNNYEEYGAKGINICSEWSNSFEKFKEWSLKNGYDEYLSLDRKDGNVGYVPNNCRWVSKNIQAQNIRQNRKNNTSGYKGVSYSKVFKKFIGYININKKRKHLGYFTNAIEGAKAYNKYVIDNKLEHKLNKIGE